MATDTVKANIPAREYSVDNRLGLSSASQSGRGESPRTCIIQASVGNAAGHHLDFASASVPAGANGRNPQSPRVRWRAPPSRPTAGWPLRACPGDVLEHLHQPWCLCLQAVRLFDAPPAGLPQAATQFRILNQSTDRLCPLRLA